MKIKYYQTSKHIITGKLMKEFYKIYKTIIWTIIIKIDYASIIYNFAKPF